MITSDMSHSQYLVSRWLFWLVAAVVLLAVFLAWYSQVEVPVQRASHEAAGDPFLEAEVGSAEAVPLPASVAVAPGRVEMGRLLFHEKRLSRDDSLACADCHPIDKGGVDGNRVSMGVGGRMGEVNAPTVLNSGFNFRQFWDGRAADLEEQASGPVHNPLEMDSNWPAVLAKLAGDARYRELAQSAYGRPLDARMMVSALAAFQRTLVTPDSPFDRYLQGHADALSAEARAGWDLFRSLGCVACHQGVNLGGNMFANLGLMEDFFADRPPAKADQGRYNVTERQEDMHHFKVPSLRNVALTAPYFHDGSVKSLEEAIKLMARYQLGVGLHPEDIQRLEAFLRSLTGRMPS